MGEIDTAIRQRGDPNFLGGPHSGGSLRKRRFPSEQMGTESSLDAFPFILDPADSNPGVGQPNRRFILEIQTDSHHSIAIIELGNRASHKPITSQVSRCKHLIAKPSRRVSLQASKPSDAPFRVFLCASETSMRGVVEDCHIS
ncbi:hypothetical protein MJO29_009895 [Puccinia striiformis f. sp. tritici]|uniref:hypothetical protein n=1 Tax=Puccinia striiformis f. sp. tritici TaxID=168172 RepID=UPI0020073D68|nr:hypothetical protein Pst134EA_018959 [Puccinia striiformis f. sp. tritici]KAH9449023.1 hypothetical protein Pst134EB_019862 [Puccinia striiformis f. sp. tritici]KAH9458803.1 hypothetical protein Pst134EA_018959 [Puccinia striiformis f. sp. tritici]KAI7948230.1 hypothetical protein MJO29_009895 [Puccinia striiformis f. sp. tritici]KAI9625551.1 hypothetical protein KEM48_010813 [Puccinia striiformis f. sp. tritici PST-130]